MAKKKKSLVGVDYEGNKIDNSLDIELLKSARIKKVIDFSNPLFNIDYSKDYLDEIHDFKTQEDSGGTLWEFESNKITNYIKPKNNRKIKVGSIFGLHNIATSGDYNDLINKPTITEIDWSNLTGKPTFAPVATSGDYNDLSGRPTIHTQNTDDRLVFTDTNNGTLFGGTIRQHLLNTSNPHDSKESILDYQEDVNSKYGYSYNYITVVKTETKSITSSDTWRVADYNAGDHTSLSNFLSPLGSYPSNDLFYNTIKYPYDCDEKLLSPISGNTNKYNFNLLSGKNYAIHYTYFNGTYSYFPILTYPGEAAFWLKDTTSVWGANPPIMVCYTNSNSVSRANSNSPNNLFSIRLCRDLIAGEELLSDGTYCADYVGNDGKVYKTVKLGTRVWLANNLAETMLRDKTYIVVDDTYLGTIFNSSAINGTSWDTAATSYAWTKKVTDVMYHQPGQIKQRTGQKLYGPRVKFGYNYNQVVVLNHQNGINLITSNNNWNIATRANFATLNSYLTTIHGSQEAADRVLKAKDDLNWNSKKSLITDLYGFGIYCKGEMSSYDTTLLYTKTIYWSPTGTVLYGTFIINVDTYGFYDSGVALIGYANNIRLVRTASTIEQTYTDGTRCEDYIGNDNTRYGTVKIGTQVWITEDLAETKYRDGSSMVYAPSTTIISTTTPYYGIIRDDLTKVFHEANKPIGGITLDKTIDFVELYQLSQSDITNLETESNWKNEFYGGPLLNHLKAGTKHKGTDYFYEFYKTGTPTRVYLKSKTKLDTLNILSGQDDPPIGTFAEGTIYFKFN